MSEIPAALAVVLHDGAVLLVRRRNRPDAGLWGYPGGKIEAGEGVEAAARRELLEETGVTARPLARLGTLEAVTPRETYLLHAVRMGFEHGEVRAGDDAEEARWFPLYHVIGGWIMASRDVDRIALRAASQSYLRL